MSGENTWKITYNYKKLQNITKEENGGGGGHPSSVRLVGELLM